MSEIQQYVVFSLNEQIYGIEILKIKIECAHAEGLDVVKVVVFVDHENPLQVGP